MSKFARFIYCKTHVLQICTYEPFTSQLWSCSSVGNSHSASEEILCVFWCRWRTVHSYSVVLMICMQCTLTCVCVCRILLSWNLVPPSPQFMSLVFCISTLLPIFITHGFLPFSQLFSSGVAESLGIQQLLYVDLLVHMDVDWCLKFMKSICFCLLCFDCVVKWLTPL